MVPLDSLKILHCADLHLDATLGDAVRSSQDEALSKEEKSLLADAPLLVLNKIKKISTDEDVKIIVVAGDLFDSREGIATNLRARTIFTEFLNEVCESGISVAIALGNHDPISSILELSAPWPNQVHIFSSRAPETLQLKIDGIEVALHGVSFETNQESRNLAEVFPKRIDNAINVGVLHTNVGGNDDHKNYAPSSIETLISHNYDYFALGHIHKRVVLNQDPTICYSGNTQALSQKPSEKEPKGCIVATFDPSVGLIDTKFFETDAVRYLDLEINLSDEIASEDISRIVSGEIEKQISNPNILYLCRVDLIKQSHDNSFNADSFVEILNEYRSNYFVTKVKLTTTNSNTNEPIDSHPFFEIAKEQAAQLKAPSFDSLYGKKSQLVKMYIDPEMDQEGFGTTILEKIQQEYLRKTKA